VSGAGVLIVALVVGVVLLFMSAVVGSIREARRPRRERRVRELVELSEREAARQLYPERR